MSDLLMSHDVSFDEDLFVIRVKHWGQATIEDFKEARDRVVQIQETRGTGDVIVDLREVMIAPPTMDIFQFASELPIQLRIAMVFSEDTQEDIRFLETVAFNRGRNINMFDNEPDALNWLGKQPSGQS